MAEEENQWSVKKNTHEKFEDESLSVFKNEVNDFLF